MNESGLPARVWVSTILGLCFHALRGGVSDIAGEATNGDHEKVLPLWVGFSPIVPIVILSHATAYICYTSYEQRVTIRSWDAAVEG